MISVIQTSQKIDSPEEVIESMGMLWDRMLTPEMQNILSREFDSVDGELTIRGRRQLGNVYGQFRRNGYLVDDEMTAIVSRLDAEIGFFGHIFNRTKRTNTSSPDPVTTSRMDDLATNNLDSSLNRQRNAEKGRRLFGSGGTLTGAEGIIRAGEGSGLTPSQSIRQAVANVKLTGKSQRPVGQAQRRAIDTLMQRPLGQQIIEMAPSKTIDNFSDPARLVPEKKRARREKAIRSLKQRDFQTKSEPKPYETMTDAEVSDAFDNTFGLGSYSNLRLRPIDIDEGFYLQVIDNKPVDEVSLFLRSEAKAHQTMLINRRQKLEPLVTLTNRTVVPESQVIEIQIKAENRLIDLTEIDDKTLMDNLQSYTDLKIDDINDLQSVMNYSRRMQYVELTGEQAARVKGKLQSHVRTLRGTTGASSLSRELQNKIMGDADATLELTIEDLGELRSSIIDQDISNRNYRDRDLENFATKAHVYRALTSISQSLIASTMVGAGIGTGLGGPIGGVIGGAAGATLGAATKYKSGFGEKVQDTAFRIDTILKSVFSENTRLRQVNPGLQDFLTNLRRDLTISTEQEVKELINAIRTVAYAKASRSVDPTKVVINEKDLAIAFNANESSISNMLSVYFGSSRPVHPEHMHKHNSIYDNFHTSTTDGDGVDPVDFQQVLNDMEVVYAHEIAINPDIKSDIELLRDSLNTSLEDLTPSQKIDANGAREMALTRLQAHVERIHNQIARSGGDILEATGFSLEDQKSLGSQLIDVKPEDIQRLAYTLFHDGRISPGSDRLLLDLSVENSIPNIQTEQDFRSWLKTNTLRLEKSKDSKLGRPTTLEALQSNVDLESAIPHQRGTPEYYQSMASQVLNRFELSEVQTVMDIKRLSGDFKPSQMFLNEDIVFEFFTRSFANDKINKRLNEFLVSSEIDTVDRAYRRYLKKENKNYSSDEFEKFTTESKERLQRLRGGAGPLEEIRGFSGAAENYAQKVFASLQLEAKPAVTTKGTESGFETFFIDGQTVLFPTEIVEEIKAVLDQVAPLNTALMKDLNGSAYQTYMFNNNMYFADLLRDELITALAQKYKQEFPDLDSELAHRLAENDELFLEYEMIMGNANSPEILKKEVQQFKEWVTKHDEAFASDLDAYNQIPTEKRKALAQEVLTGARSGGLERILDDNTRFLVETQRTRLQNLATVGQFAMPFIMGNPITYVLGTLAARKAIDVSMGLMSKSRGWKDYGFIVAEQNLTSDLRSKFLGRDKEMKLRTLSDFVVGERAFLADRLAQKRNMRQRVEEAGRDPKEQVQSTDLSVLSPLSKSTKGQGSLDEQINEFINVNNPQNVVGTADPNQLSRFAALAILAHNGVAKGGRYLGRRRFGVGLDIATGSMNVFKQSLTAGFLGLGTIAYQLNNVMGMLYQTYLVDGHQGLSGMLGQTAGKRPGLTVSLVHRLMRDRKIRPDIYGLTGKVSTRRFKNDNRFLVSEATGRVYTEEELLSELKRLQIGSSFVGAELGSKLMTDLNLSKDLGIYRGFGHAGLRSTFDSLRDFSEYLDLMFRIMHVQKLLDEGVPLETAVNRTRKVFYDYADITDVEKKYFRQLFTFWSWAKKNQAAHHRAVFENPSKLLKIYRFMQNTQENAMAEDREAELYDPRNSHWIDSWARRRAVLSFTPELNLGDELSNNRAQEYLLGKLFFHPNYGTDEGLELGLGLLANLITQPTETALSSTAESLLLQANPVLQLGSTLVTDQIPFGKTDVRKLTLTEKQYQSLNSLELDWLIGFPDIDEEGNIIQDYFINLERITDTKSIKPNLKGQRKYRVADSKSGLRLEAAKNMFSAVPEIGRTEGQTELIKIGINYVLSGGQTEKLSEGLTVSDHFMLLLGLSMNMPENQRKQILDKLATLNYENMPKQ